MNRHIPRKRFGQHFLHDKRIIQKIIDSLNIEDSDSWVEIGPGQAALTEFIPKSIKHLYLIEIDRDLAARLSNQYQNQTNLSVINQDVLNVDLRSMFQQVEKLRVLGNLPYNISTPIFFHLAQYVDIIKDMTFMVQKEVADRLVAQPGNKNYGRLTLSAGLRFETHRLFDVGAGAFNPPPKVTSTVIRLKPHDSQTQRHLRNVFDDLVKTAFSKRRKTLKNSLGNVVNLQIFEQTGIDPTLRAESLSKSEFLKLAKRVI